MTLMETTTATTTRNTHSNAENQCAECGKFARLRKLPGKRDVCSACFGKILSAEDADANVALVRLERVRLVHARVPASVRKALGTAVKSGRLGHMKKSVNKPEAYFHPSAEFLAIELRSAAARASSEALIAFARACASAQHIMEEATVKDSLTVEVAS